MRHFLLLIALLALTSCSRTTQNETVSSTLPSKQTSGLTISLTAFDLSEDFNPISTQDDEVVLLLYSNVPDQEIPTLLLQESFTLDSAQMSIEFELADTTLVDQELTLVLLEMDSKLTLRQIEPIVRLNLNSFKPPSQREDQSVMRELLGDDDLLGVFRFNAADLSPKGKEFEVSGRRLFDSYMYRLEVRNYR